VVFCYLPSDLFAAKSGGRDSSSVAKEYAGSRSLEVGFSEEWGLPKSLAMSGYVLPQTSGCCVNVKGSALPFAQSLWLTDHFGGRCILKTIATQTVSGRASCDPCSAVLSPIEERVM
jgi:hypothetical protein